MTLRPFTNASRPTTRLRDTDTDRTGSDRPEAELEHDAEGKGVQFITTMLLGLTVIGAVGMLAFNWTMT
ncbi:hypothetical protein [Methylobacterium sp. J-090]|uniref:hypothetical protein n=1 Tax=Methylobacterium sp. J-090 TaxID=2836666 RepID=UPI001FB8E628|nr:hypothetical protein [Methylobacterium sp. J-090]MCJ2082766.1 hypothetical protein [Methylobacterium sp. J-090]